jgi:hypothetical protein
MSVLRQAIILIEYQSVSALGQEFPELCDGTIALYHAHKANVSPEVIGILEEYAFTEKMLKDRWKCNQASALVLL